MKAVLVCCFLALSFQAAVGINKNVLANMRSRVVTKDMTSYDATPLELEYKLTPQKGFDNIWKLHSDVVGPILKVFLKETAKKCSKFEAEALRKLKLVPDVQPNDLAFLQRAEKFIKKKNEHAENMLVFNTVTFFLTAPLDVVLGAVGMPGVGKVVSKSVSLALDLVNQGIELGTDIKELGKDEDLKAMFEDTSQLGFFYHMYKFFKTKNRDEIKKARENAVATLKDEAKEKIKKGFEKGLDYAGEALEEAGHELLSQGVGVASQVFGVFSLAYEGLSIMKEEDKRDLVLKDYKKSKKWPDVDSEALKSIMKTAGEAFTKEHHKFINCKDALDKNKASVLAFSSAFVDVKAAKDGVADILGTLARSNYPSEFALFQADSRFYAASKVLFSDVSYKVRDETALGMINNALRASGLPGIEKL